MGLSYNDQYNIASGIWTSFSAKNSKRILAVSHKQKKRDSIKSRFPYRTYELWTKSNFIIASLYVCFHRSPSSLNSMYDLLSEIEEIDIMRFKNEIIHYRKFLIEDLERIRIEESNNVSLEYMIQEYRNSKIKWYTFYFFLVVSGVDISKIERSRINGHLLKKIRKLLLYVTFSEKSMLEVKSIISDTIEI